MPTFAELDPDVQPYLLACVTATRPIVGDAAHLSLRVRAHLVNNASAWAKSILQTLDPNSPIPNDTMIRGASQVTVQQALDAIAWLEALDALLTEDLFGIASSAAGPDQVVPKP